MPVHAREAIIKLIDLYGDELRISRRQLADDARVNPGQVSNWLRNDGPMGVDKEGRVTDTMLRRLDEYLERTPNTPIARPLRLLRQPLQSFGPRKRMYAAQPDAAMGQPISRDNPHYITRSCDLDLDDKLRNDVIGIEITGGPKMGKSSLLLAAQQVLETNRTAILVDLKEFTPSSTDIRDEDYERELMRWIRQRAEEQLSGTFPEVMESPGDLPNWAESNLLPNSVNGKCVLLFDNLTSLKPAGVSAVDRGLHLASVKRGLRAQLRRFGVVVAYDRAHARVAGDDGHMSSRGGRLDPVRLALFEENHVGSLLLTHDPAGVDESGRAKVFEWAGGHPYLSQCLGAALFRPDVDAAWESAWRLGIAELAERMRGWSETAQKAWSATKPQPGTYAFEYRMDSGLQRFRDDGGLAAASPRLLTALAASEGCGFLKGK